MKILKNKDGFSYVLVCIIVLFSVMLIFAGLQYRYVFHMIDSQKDEVKLKLNSLVTKSAVEYYDALKQGNSYNSYIDSTKFKESAYLDLGFGNSGVTEKTVLTDANVVCTMSRPTIEYISDEGFGLYVSYTLTVPFGLFGKNITGIQVPVEIYAMFNEK